MKTLLLIGLAYAALSAVFLLVFRKRISKRRRELTPQDQQRLRRLKLRRSVGVAAIMAPFAVILAWPGGVPDAAIGVVAFVTLHAMAAIAVLTNSILELEFKPEDEA